MKHCPHCQSEFEDVIEACPDCHVPLDSAQAAALLQEANAGIEALLATNRVELDTLLQEARAARHLGSSTFVTAGRADDRFEADRLEVFLHDEGIEHVMLVARGNASADMLSKFSPGFFDVLVLQADRERAAALIDEARATFAARDEEFETALRDEALSGTENDNDDDDGDDWVDEKDGLEDLDDDEG
ncbi:MAG: zinc ribbon domain-containing protein [Myxococcales bacterium]|nr:zinc ribbon domain-containing protein [Myxococcales bacterium]